MGSEGLHTAILLTGSNLGIREKNLHIAFKFIEEKVGEVRKYSALYESDPWGNKDQPAFINQALMVSTTISPPQLLQAIHHIEQSMGRIRNQKWEARLIDIDIIFYDDLIISVPGLTVPHPEFTNRSFAILPVMEIVPDFIHPQNHLSMQQILKASKDDGTITKLKNHVS